MHNNLHVFGFFHSLNEYTANIRFSLCFFFVCAHFLLGLLLSSLPLWQQSVANFSIIPHNPIGWGTKQHFVSFSFTHSFTTNIVVVVFIVICVLHEWINYGFIWLCFMFFLFFFSGVSVHTLCDLLIASLPTIETAESQCRIDKFKCKRISAIVLNCIFTIWLASLHMCSSANHKQKIGQNFNTKPATIQ